MFSLTELFSNMLYFYIDKVCIECICKLIFILLFIFKLIFSPQRSATCDRWALETKHLWISIAFSHFRGLAELPLKGNTCSWAWLHRKLTVVVTRLANEPGFTSGFTSGTRRKCHGTVHIHMVKFLLSLEEAYFIHAAHWSLPKGPVQIGWQGPVSSMGPLGPGIV